MDAAMTKAWAEILCLHDSTHYIQLGVLYSYACTSLEAKKKHHSERIHDEEDHSMNGQGEQLNHREIIKEPKQQREAIFT
jgi:hypothetical protein